MSEKPDNGKQLESLDFVETAVDLLDSSRLNYILFVGTHTKGTTIQSGLDDDSAKTLLDWLTCGEFNKITLEHLQRFFPHLFE